MIYNMFLILLCSVSCVEQRENSDSENHRAENSKKLEQEDFFSFFQLFCTVESFQRNRIVFPLKSVRLSDDLNTSLESQIKSEDWRFIQIKKFENNTFETYFPSFSKTEIPETDEMVYAIGGIENGTNVKYFFRRIKGNWFLVKIENRST